MLEFAHRFQVTPWAYFQPDIQLVINPGGTGDIEDALVIGAQMGVTFLNYHLAAPSTPPNEHASLSIPPRGWIRIPPRTYVHHR